MLISGHSGTHMYCNIGDSLVTEFSLLAIYCDFSCPIRQFNIEFCVYDISGDCNKINVL